MSNKKTKKRKKHNKSKKARVSKYKTRIEKNKAIIVPEVTKTKRKIPLGGKVYILYTSCDKDLYFHNYIIINII